MVHPIVVGRNFAKHLLNPFAGFVDIHKSAASTNMMEIQPGSPAYINGGRLLMTKPLFV
jgi:hypothetical protein